jgi:integrase
MHSDKGQGAADTSDENLEDAMRVPISLSDLSPKKGFYRLAKNLKRDWPGEAHLSSDAAHEILARGLGYRDLHDVQQSATAGDGSCATALSQDEVRDNISTAIVVFFKAKNIFGIDESAVGRLVMSLPLQELAVFKPRRSEQPPFSLSTRPSVEIISVESLRKLSEVIQRKGMLRDQCLWSGLLVGIRAVELLNTKVRDVSFDISANHEHVTLKLQRVKSHSATVDLLMPSSFGGLLGEHIRQAGLSSDDYLFGSARYPGMPMTPRALQRVIAPYLREAQLEQIQTYAYLIRRSMRELAINNQMEFVRLMAGHPDINSVLRYLNLPLSIQDK